MTNPTAIDSLRTAFTAVASNASTLSAQETDFVRRRVHDVVDELKASGVLPERIIVVIKKLALEAGLAWTGTRLVDQIVNWTLERFYARPDGPPPPDVAPLTNQANANAQK